MGVVLSPIDRALKLYRRLFWTSPPLSLEHHRVSSDLLVAWIGRLSVRDRDAYYRGAAVMRTEQPVRASELEEDLIVWI